MKIKTEDLVKELIGEAKKFPKYTTQILNIANQNAQGTRPSVVGQMSELIQQCPHKDYKSWERWYLAKKPDAIPTHLITLQLLKEKLSLDAIAERRGLVIGTIISHLEKLKGLNLIDNTHLSTLKEKVSPQDFDDIFTALEKSEDGKIKSIYDQFEGKYSYASIQIVRLFFGLETDPS